MPKIINTPKRVAKKQDQKLITPSAVYQQVITQFNQTLWLIGHLGTSPKVCLSDIEVQLSDRISHLGRLFILLAMAIAERTHNPAPGPEYIRRPKQSKWVGTIFGMVLYWRTYWRSAPHIKKRTGIHPIDQKLEITRDRYSMRVMSTCSRLATHIPYDTCCKMIKELWGWSPGKDSIENMVLGLGAFTQDFFFDAPPPRDDGEILVIQIDGKGAPMATESELRKRRQPRGPKEQSLSPRHRNYRRRQRWDGKGRRAPGDKSKNAKMATMVVMYTLKIDGQQLLGPINKRTYGSFGPKRLAFEYAMHEAQKRGFGPQSNQMVHFLSDGDPDLRRLAKVYLPHAIQTIDIIHVLEYIWSAGGCFHRASSDELKGWVSECKLHLLEGNPEIVIQNLVVRRNEVELSQGNDSSEYKTLSTAIHYLESNLDRLNYRWATKHDLDLATGAVEGIIKHVTGKRLDNGSMRWIVERAQCVLQLRCIEVNEMWQEFIAYVQKRYRRELIDGEPVRIMRSQPIPLPEPTINPPQPEKDLKNHWLEKIAA